MFGAAQCQVGVADFGRLALRAQALAFEHCESAQRRPRAERGVTATPDQLQSLHEKFGFANAAGAELQIAIRVGRQLGARTPDQLNQLVRQRRVDAAPSNEWRERREQQIAERQVSSDWPSAQHRGALPQPTEGLVIALGGSQ